jgi:hypothetical protein
MILCLLARGGALVYLLANVHTVLPNGVLGCTALVCAVFATLVFHYFAKGIKRREMEFAFILNSIIVLLNMFMLRFSVPSTLNLFEYLAAGTLFEVVVGIAFVILSKQRTTTLMAQKGI